MKNYYKVEWMTQEFLKETFTYCDSGNLIWRHDRPASHFATLQWYKTFMVQRSGIVAGKIAINERSHSTRKNIRDVRTVQVSFVGEKIEFKLHQLIFLYHKGYSPELIDHVDGNYLNNKIENLQELNPQLNTAKAGMYLNNTTGYRGVSLDKRSNTFIAQIKVSYSAGKIRLYLGSYNTAEQAAMVYNYASKSLFGELAFQNKVPSDTELPEMKAPVFINGLFLEIVKKMDTKYDRFYKKK